MRERLFDRVMLIQQPNTSRDGRIINFEPAFDLLSKGGEVVTMLPSAPGLSMSPSEAYATMAAQFDKHAPFDPDSDAFLWAGGDNLALVVLGALIRAQGLGSFVWLRFDRKLDDHGRRVDGFYYTPIEVPVFSYEEEC